MGRIRSRILIDLTLNCNRWIENIAKIVKTLRWYKKSMGGADIFADPWHFGTNADADPDPRIRTSGLQIRMRIQEPRKYTDPTDPDPEHWYIILTR